MGQLVRRVDDGTIANLVSAFETAMVNTNAAQESVDAIGGALNWSGNAANQYRDVLAGRISGLHKMQQGLDGLGQALTSQPRFLAMRRIWLSGMPSGTSHQVARPRFVDRTARCEASTPDESRPWSAARNCRTPSQPTRQSTRRLAAAARRAAPATPA
jgi:hypothetical protein